MKFGVTLTKLRQHSRRNVVNNNNNNNNNKRSVKSKSSKLTKQQQHQLFDSDGEEEDGDQVLDVAAGKQPPYAEPESAVNLNKENKEKAKVPVMPAAVSVSSTHHTPLTVSLSTTATEPKPIESAPGPAPAPASFSPSQAAAAKAASSSSSGGAANRIVPKPSIPRQTKSVKQRAFRERLQSLSRDLIQESPSVAAAAAAAAVVTPTASAVDAIAATTPTTTYDMDPGGANIVSIISPLAVVLTSTSTSTSLSGATSVASPATVPSDLGSSFSVGDDDVDDDASTLFEISQTDTHPQQQTKGAFDIVRVNRISSNTHLPPSQEQQQQQQERDLSSPQETMLTEGGTISTTTSFSHGVSMTNADTTTAATSVYTLQTTAEEADAESYKSNNSHWIDALTWSWGRNPCLVLEELVDMWDPEEASSPPPTTIHKKDRNKKKNSKTKSNRSRDERSTGWFNNNTWLLSKWNIASHGEEMRFSDCTNSVIRSSDSSSTMSRNNNNNNSINCNKRVASSSGIAAKVTSNLFSNMTACNAPSTSTSSSTPSQEGFERQVSSAPEQSSRHEEEEEAVIVGPTYVEEEGGVTVPAHVIALGKKDEFHTPTAAWRNSASGGGGAAGIRMSPSDASTITTAFSFH